MLIQTETNRLDKAYRYAEDIKSGTIPACKWVRLAIDRFYDDLKNGHSRGLHFSEDQAEIRLKFFDLMFIKRNQPITLPNGRQILKATPGQFILESWQTFIIANKYGWYKEEFRRFTESIVCVARKNGKTTFAAGDAILALLGDGEWESHVYCLANKKDQAQILFKEAKKICMISPELKGYLGKDNILKDTINDFETNSFFQPLSADANTLDGLNPHKVELDETHEYKTSELRDVMKSAQGNRLNPMLDIISTAGFNKTYWFYEYLQNALGILEGNYVDDSMFIMYYTQDSEEEIYDPKLRIKSNPNLGVSIQNKYLDEQVNKMKNNPSTRVGVLTKNFNMFVDSATTWIESEIWNAQYKPIHWLQDQSIKAVYGGIDLASSRDIYAITWLYELHNGTYYITHRFYTPGNNLESRYTTHIGQLFSQYIAEGWLHTTPGKTIDNTLVEDYIINKALELGVKFIGYDPYKATDMSKNISDGLGMEMIYNPQKGKIEEFTRMQPIRQNVTNLAEPTLKLEEWLVSGTLFHDGNPMMGWMMSNVEIVYDSTGNPKPDRKNVNKKIDGVYSTLDAIKIKLTFTELENNLDDYMPA